MLGLKVEKKDAQNAKEELVARGALARGFKAFGKGNFVFFPLVEKTEVRAKHSFVEKNFAQTLKPPSLKELVRKIYPKMRDGEVFSSYDLIGDIALLEIPRKFLKKRKEIARALLLSNKRINTVLRKVGKRKGKYRLLKHEWLAGQKKLVTTHKESGCLMKVNVAKAFFNSKMGTQRSRIAAKAEKGERVLVLFAGVGPFALVIAKKKNALVKAVEINPIAVKLMKENVLLNKLQGQIEVFQGDVKHYLTQLGPWADRIIMPLAVGGEKYLGKVVENARKGTTIHYFSTGNEREGIYSKALKQIEAVCKPKKRKFAVLEKSKGWPYAPRVFVVVIDFKLLN